MSTRTSWGSRTAFRPNQSSNEPQPIRRPLPDHLRATFALPKESTWAGIILSKDARRASLLFDVPNISCRRFVQEGIENGWNRLAVDDRPSLLRCRLPAKGDGARKSGDALHRFETRSPGEASCRPRSRATNRAGRVATERGHMIDSCVDEFDSPTRRRSLRSLLSEMALHGENVRLWFHPEGRLALGRAKRRGRLGLSLG